MITYNEKLKKYVVTINKNPSITYIVGYTTSIKKAEKIEQKALKSENYNKNIEDYLIFKEV